MLRRLQVHLGEDAGAYMPPGGEAMNAGVLSSLELPQADHMMPEPVNNTDSLIRQTVRHARRLVISVIGATVLALGVLGIILPGVPAFILLPAGMAILATEFVWARRLLKRIRAEIEAIKRRKAAAKSGRAAGPGQL